jgi:hypothetical protein
VFARAEGVPLDRGLRRWKADLVARHQRDGLEQT